MSKFGNVTQLDPREYGRPPKPTVKDPFAQLNWIFNRRRDRAANTSTKDNYQSAKSFFIRHVEICVGKAPYILADKWDEFALLRFKGQLQDRIDAGELSLRSYTLVGHFSAVRQVMKEAAAYGILNTRVIQDTSWGAAFSETNAHTSYTDDELSQVLAAVAEELRFTYAVSAGYARKPRDIGRDPRIKPERRGLDGYGFGVEENMRWYFENVLNCEPIVGVGRNKAEHKKFIAAATNIHGGLHDLYRRWGVSAYIDENLLMPLVVYLQYLTGLNPSSILGLKVDCLRDEHPLTGMPCLLFEKQRSGGEKELHLPLLDARAERSLKRKQSLQVKRVVETLIKLTDKIRDRLPQGDPNRELLLIYESTGARTHGAVLPMTAKQTSAWCKRMTEIYCLRNTNNARLEFNLVRFRSTKLTEMALEGRDFFEIQQVARHKSIAQTVRYISRNRLDAPARAVVSEALERIRANQEEVVSETKAHDVLARPIHLYKGLIADCKNVFDPPDRVKRSVDYVPGQACTRFNMCLFCRNVVVLKAHLPALAAYRAQILAVMENNVQNLPHATLYNQTLSVLDDLLNPVVSQFSLDEIEWALDMATSVDMVVDPLLYRGECR